MTTEQIIILILIAIVFIFIGINVKMFMDKRNEPEVVALNYTNKITFLIVRRYINKKVGIIKIPIDPRIRIEDIENLAKALGFKEKTNNEKS